MPNHESSKERPVRFEQRQPLAHQRLFRLVRDLLLEEDGARRAQRHQRVTLTQEVERLVVEVFEGARVETRGGRCRPDGRRVGN